MVWFTTRKKCSRPTATAFAGKKVVISGSGNVAQYALQKATELGATVISVSDSNGYVIDENGIDFDLLTDVKEKRRARLTEYAAEKPTAKYYEGSVWTYAGNYDIALPCATQNEIDGDAAKRLVAQGVKLSLKEQTCQVTSMPSTYTKKMVSFTDLLKQPMLVGLLYLLLK